MTLDALQEFMESSQEIVHGKSDGMVVSSHGGCGGCSSRPWEDSLGTESPICSYRASFRTGLRGCRFDLSVDKRADGHSFVGRNT